MAENIELLGVEEMAAKLKKLNAQAGRVENKAMREGAKLMRDAIARRAPRSPAPRQPQAKGTRVGKKGNASQRWRTGKHAADNIKVGNVRKDRAGKYVLVGVQKGDNSRYFYLKFIEWGSTKLSAQPFMEPTYQEEQQAVLQKIRDELKAGLGL